MLASASVRTLAERRPTSGTAVGSAAAAVCFSALFFAGGSALAPLVWIGGLAIGLAALVAAAAVAGVLPAPSLDRSGAAFLGCLFGLAVWVGLTTVWSASPDSSWMYTNRTLVYAAFGLLGVLVAALLPRPAATLAGAAAGLLGLVFGWALLAKCVPSLYSDYGRVARLRAPVGYWNELALLAAVAVPLALGLAAPRARGALVRAGGVVLLYGAALTVLLTYSRFGIALACLTAIAWIVLDEDRVEGLAAVAVAGGAGAAVFGVALALPGITKDGQPRSVRAHDGWIFALAVVAGAVAVLVVAALLVRRTPPAAETRRRVERAAALAVSAAAIAALVVAIVFAGRIWHSFANPVSSQITSGSAHLDSLSSSNRWRWWQEAWHAFVRHPGGGTGAGTFQITDLMLRDSPLTTTEPHNVPLQFLSETGIVGLLLLAGAAVFAGIGISRARARARGTERAAATALAIGAAAFLAHLVADVDWDYVATCGPLLFVAGALVGAGRAPAAPARAAARRPLLAAAAVLFALAAVYSLAAPWLAQRQIATASTLAAVKRAHAFDPLSTDVLTEWATFEDGFGDAQRADQLYRDAVALEPENAETWFALGDFYWFHRRYMQAYIAYDRSWHDDRFGPAGTPCGKLDQARHRVLGVWPASCPGGRPAASP
jgi:O-Antigen ligase